MCGSSGNQTFAILGARFAGHQKERAAVAILEYSIACDLSRIIDEHRLSRFETTRRKKDAQVIHGAVLPQERPLGRECAVDGRVADDLSFRIDAPRWIANITL
jgi:hypothetical protein